MSDGCDDCVAMCYDCELDKIEEAIQQEAEDWYEYAGSAQEQQKQQPVDKNKSSVNNKKNDNK